MNNPHAVIIRPVLTEKTAELSADNNQYVFEVHRAANKIEVRNAVEMVFGVRVNDVRTQVVRGSMRRVGQHYGNRNTWKKAIVSIHPEDSIDLYGEE